MAKPSKAPRTRKAAASMRRNFVTPEGVDLKLDLATAGARAAAFTLDVVFMLIILIVGSIAIALLLTAYEDSALGILWLFGFFTLVNGWFILFEMGGRGATPGKRILGLRVVARDGARLTGGAVVARNAIRGVEVFLPFMFMMAQLGQHDPFDTLEAIFSLCWTCVFLFFPLFNRDRLRVGDLLAGTWVVQTVSGKLGHDLVAGADHRARRTFSDAALGLYGVYELQTLEDVLRGGRDEAIATVAWTIRNKAGIADDGDDFGFLSDYYAALCARLERGMMLGRRREDKFAASRG
ncbi:MAG: RDD family protein [Sphingomonas sp.]